MTRVIGLLFDMDGVVCHNMPAHEEAWTRFFRARGIEIGLRDFRENTMGMPTRAVLEYYFKRPVPADEAAALAVEKETLYRKLYRPRRKVMPGLRALLSGARREGMRLGVGTGSKDDNVTFILDGLRLRSAFDAVVDGGMVRKGKPDPETWLTLADAIEVRPRDCVVFEDSLLGEEAARRAGMSVVGVCTSHRADEFRVARRVVRTFATFSPADARRLAPRPAARPRRAKAGA